MRKLRQHRCRVTASDWLPHSTFRRIWSLVCFSALLYNIYAVPRDCAFFLTHNRFEAPDSEAFVDICLFWTGDVIFALDFFFHCRRFAIEHDGHVIMDRKKIQRLYLWSVGGILDLISIVPLDFMAALVSMKNLPFLRLNKVRRNIWYHEMHMYKQFFIYIWVCGHCICD